MSATTTTDHVTRLGSWDVARLSTLDHISDLVMARAS
jgi:hypothetical protein